jgi:type II secretory pathway pseudopilin PulG
MKPPILLRRLDAAVNPRADTVQAANALPSAGFTFTELIFVVSLLGAILASVSGLLTTNSNLASETRTHQLAAAAHRQNHAALARVLRGIDLQSLSGFDTSGVATSPGFRRVTGADLDNLTSLGDERLLWVAAPLPVNGIDHPGAIYLVRDGTNYLVADRVPRDGFQVTQEGQSLLVRLTTYYATSADKVATKTSESAISVRN